MGCPHLDYTREPVKGPRGQELSIAGPLRPYCREEPGRLPQSKFISWDVARCRARGGDDPCWVLLRRPPEPVNPPAPSIASGSPPVPQGLSASRPPVIGATPQRDAVPPPEDEAAGLGLLARAAQTAVEVEAEEAGQTAPKRRARRLTLRRRTSALYQMTRLFMAGAAIADAYIESAPDALIVHIALCDTSGRRHSFAFENDVRLVEAVREWRQGRI